MCHYDFICIFMLFIVVTFVGGTEWIGCLGAFVGAIQHIIHLRETKISEILHVKYLLLLLIAIS